MSLREDNTPSIPPSEWTRERLKQGLNNQGYTFLHKLSRKLDVGSQWRDLAANLPNLTYEEHEVERFAMAVTSPSGSPGYLLLLDLTKRCYPLENFITALKSIDCEEGLKFLGYTEKVKVVKHPESRPITIGEKLELFCEGTGVPRPEYLWFRADIHGNPYPLTDQKSSHLVIEEVKKENAGRYCCRVMNKYNQDFSRWVEIVVKEPQGLNGAVIPNIHPDVLPVVLDFPREKHVSIGNTLVITCDARGDQPLQYQWFRNGRLLNFSRRHELVIERVGVEHGGEYECNVSNRFGDKLSQTCTVIIHNQPTPVSTVAQQEVMHNEFGDSLVSPNWVQNFASPLVPPPAHPQPHHPVYPTYAERIPESRLPPNAISTVYPPQGEFRPPHDWTPVSPPADPPPVLQQNGQGPPVVCTDKVALLIGNMKYRVSRHNNLSTPETDVQDLAGLLTSLDFKCVSLINLTKEEMDHAIHYFLSLLGRGVYALFFFAGHGFEVGNHQYLMSVDASADHNPKECVCVQTLKDEMHRSGSKLNILLLDMCRDKLTTPMPHPAHFAAEKLNHPCVNQSIPYNTYTVIGYATSEAGLSYEPRAQTRQSNIEQNSFFVKAIKEALESQKNSDMQSLYDFLSQVQKNVRRLKPKAIGNGPWQLPQIVSNLGEDLSLADKIEESADHAIESERQTRQTLWGKAITIPKDLIVSSSNQIAPFRLSFEAEHTNVLIVTVELLKGSKWWVQIQDLSLALGSNRSCEKMLNSAMGMERLLGARIEDTVEKYPPKESARKDITFFRVLDIQKVRPPVLMDLTVTYKYSSHDKSFLEQTNEATETVSVEFRDPPLYSSLYI